MLITELWEKGMSQMKAVVKCELFHTHTCLHMVVSKSQGPLTVNFTHASNCHYIHVRHINKSLPPWWNNNGYTACAQFMSCSWKEVFKKLFAVDITRTSLLKLSISWEEISLTVRRCAPELIWDQFSDIQTWLKWVWIDIYLFMDLVSCLIPVKPQSAK